MAVSDFITPFLNAFNSAEITAAEMLTRFDYDAASGKALDDIAGLINVQRLVADDDTVRRRIRARVALNNCDGTLEGLKQALKLLLNADIVRIVSLGDGLSQLEITGADIDDWGVDYINSVPMAGTGFDGIIIYDDEDFTFDDETRGFDAGELGINY